MLNRTHERANGFTPKNIILVPISIITGTRNNYLLIKKELTA